MTQRDDQRDERINMEIIVDAYTQEEQAMGWHIYLEETMKSPLEARCIHEQEVSPRDEWRFYGRLTEIEEDADSERSPEVVDQTGEPIEQYAPPEDRR